MQFLLIGFFWVNFQSNSWITPTFSGRGGSDTSEWSSGSDQSSGFSVSAVAVAAYARCEWSTGCWPTQFIPSCSPIGSDESNAGSGYEWRQWNASSCTGLHHRIGKFRRKKKDKLDFSLKFDMNEWGDNSMWFFFAEFPTESNGESTTRTQSIGHICKFTATAT